MRAESTGGTLDNPPRVELFTKSRCSPLFRKAQAVLVRLGFDVVVRDTSKDAQALADLCWLDGSPMELPLVVVWRGESIVARLGRREMLSGMALRLREVVGRRATPG